jgi:hypothetical protein
MSGASSKEGTLRPQMMRRMTRWLLRVYHIYHFLLAVLVAPQI